MSEQVTSFVRWYGYSGLLPFLGLSTLVIADAQLPVGPPTLDLFMYWSAIILSFMAAIIWGLALFVGGIKEKPALTFSVILAILGWLALLLPAQVALLLLSTCYLALWRFEQLPAFRQVYSLTYRQLRTQLTLLVVLCHLLILLFA